MLDMLAIILLLGGVGLKVPGLPKSVDLAVLLKDCSIFSGSTVVLSDDRVDAVTQFLIVWIGPVSTHQALLFGLIEHSSTLQAQALTVS